MATLSQEDLLLYQRAETANEEVLDMLGQVAGPTTPLHGEALAASRRLAELLAALLRATGHGSASGPRRRVGAAIHTPAAFAGAIGSEEVHRLAALGDAPNTAARLAASAGPRRSCSARPSRRPRAWSPPDVSVASCSSGA